MARVAPEWLRPDRYPFHCRITTRFADIDPNQHINNVALAAAFEDARVRFGMSRADLVRRHARLMIVANDIAYLAEAHYPDPLDMFVGVVEIGRTSWTLASLAVQGERVCAYARAVLVATVEGRPIAIDDAFRAQLETGRLEPVAAV